MKRSVGGFRFLRFLDQPDNAGNRVIRGRASDADAQHRFLVDRTANTASPVPSTSEPIPGDRGFIDARRALDNLTISGDAVARPRQNNLAGIDRCCGYFRQLGRSTPAMPFLARGRPAP